MPEGDAVLLTARRLHTALAGRTLTDAQLRWPSLATVDLRGAHTHEVVPAGKHILHRMSLPDGERVTLHSHLRMDGSWRTRRRSSPQDRPPRLPHDVRALLGTDETWAVGRLLGMMDLLRTADEHRLIGHLGPDVLGESWDPALVASRLEKDPRPVAEALLDQRLLAGIGTYWAAEVLWREQVDPWRPSRRVPAETHERIVAWLPVAMRAAVSTQRPMFRTNGPGDPTDMHDGAVHAKSGHPCRRCGDTVRVAPLGSGPHARVFFYCPSCQGGLAPTDDGRPQRPLGATPADGASDGARRGPRYRRD